MPRPTLLVVSLILCAAPPARGGDVADAPRHYPHKSLVATSLGTGAQSYWIFEPAEPTPKTAPVVVFHHGWLAYNPGVYGAWIEHLARSGRIVIFPRYQTEFTSPADFLPNSIAAVRDALDVLTTAPGRVRPDLARFAVIGHSAGGNLSAQMAAVAEAEGLPIPKAVVAVCPGEVRPLVEPSLATIPPDTLMAIAAASDDRIVGDGRAREIYAQATSLSPARKKFVLYRSDRFGPAHLVADHFAPTAALPALDSGEGVLRGKQMRQATVNILDRHGFWRMADLTMEAGFAGITLDEATGNGALFRDLGRWSDGRVVTPPICEDDLATVPRVHPVNGIRLVPWPAIEVRRVATTQKP